MISPKVIYNLASALNKSTIPKIICNSCIRYSKKTSDDECARAYVDIPPEEHPECPPCERRPPKKQGILHRIKLKIIEGGTNFGTPFKEIKCDEKKVCKEVAISEPPKALPKPAVQKAPPPLVPLRPGVQVSILGAETGLGQYVALLLKQCPCIKKLRLYEASDSESSVCPRDVCSVADDLHQIDTNCVVQGFSRRNNELDRCLQNSDIVLMLDNSSVKMDMPFEERFNQQAPIVKSYADAISTECPKAFIIVCATPVDCMVPLVAETLKETGWYNPRKLLGSLAVPEMRASTLAARVLCLDPSYIKIPCVGGTEGEALVPLFSKAVDYFDFTMQNAIMMTNTIRDTPFALAKSDSNCIKAAELSEAHALAGLVTKVAWAQLCVDVPRVTGFVETDPAHVLSPARFIANTVEIKGTELNKYCELPKLSANEIKLVNLALNELLYKHSMVTKWYKKYCSTFPRLDACQDKFFAEKSYQSFDDCAYASM